MVIIFFWGRVLVGNKRGCWQIEIDESFGVKDYDLRADTTYRQGMVLGTRQIGRNGPSAEDPVSQNNHA